MSSPQFKLAVLQAATPTPPQASTVSWNRRHSQAGAPSPSPRPLLAVPAFIPPLFFYPFGQTIFFIHVACSSGMSGGDQLSFMIAQSKAFNRTFSSFGLALLYYDFFLTLPLEAERFWKHRQSWASLFFYLNRYTPMLFHVPVIYEFFFVMPEARCRQLQTFHQVFSALGQGIIAICLLLRTHALYMRNRRILYFLGGIVVLGVVVCVWTIVWVGVTRGDSSIPGNAVISIGCIVPVSPSQSLLLAVAWSVMFLFDGTVFVLTFFQAIRVYRLWGYSLATLMLKDGTVYFVVLGICCLLNIVTYAIASPSYNGVFTTATNILSNVFVSRMMLNIRDPTLFELPQTSPSKYEEISVPDYGLSSEPHLWLNDSVRLL